VKTRSCILASALLFLGAPARADIPPPNRAQCDDKGVGDTCLTDSNLPGKGAKATCTRPSRPTEDGGLDDGGSYDCRRCETVGTGGCRKGSSCSAGAGDLGSGLVLVAIVLPLLVRRRKR